MSLPLGAALRRRPPLVGLASDTLPGWAACLLLTGWVMLVPSSRIEGLPARALWLAIVIAVAVGLAVGARMGDRRAIIAMVTVWVVGTTLAIAAVGAAILLRPIGPGRVPQPVQLMGAAIGLSSLIGIAIGRRRRIGVRPAELLVVGVVTIFLITDWAILHQPLMRDLLLDLGAGDRFLHGLEPYLSAPVTDLPKDMTRLPFLYPPLTLPFFALLSIPPTGLVVAGWVAISLAGSVVALRWLGVRWAWLPLLLLWPSFFEGMAAGNVAILAFILFAAAPRAPWALPMMGIFKFQSLVPSLWLVRERRWASIAIGLALVGVLAVTTLPIVGLGAWTAWLHGLFLYQQSQVRLLSLYGWALPRFLPYDVFLILSVVVVTIAVVYGRGLVGLARLGIASVVASPSLYSHGLLIALPGMLGNGALVLWLALGLSGFTYPTGWWLALGVAAVGTRTFVLSRPREPETTHPLGSTGSPWSDTL